jgi:hypothetical protein
MRVVTLGALGQSEETVTAGEETVTIVDGNGITITESRLSGLRAYIYGGAALMAGFLGYTAFKKLGG